MIRNIKFSHIWYLMMDPRAGKFQSSGAHEPTMPINTDGCNKVTSGVLDGP